MKSADAAIPTIRTHELATAALAESGAVFIEWDSHAPIEEVAARIGRPVPIRAGGNVVDVLTPRTTAQATSRSLSGLYGRGAFPWHTECAHWRTPPHYFVLRLPASGQSDRPTLLSDFRALPLDAQHIAELKWHLWVTRGGRGVHLTPLLNDTLVPGEQILRYDMDSLVPAVGSAIRARDILDVVLAELEPVEIHWTEGHVLVVDNWRWLHARGEGPDAASLRVLERVLVA